MKEREIRTPILKMLLFKANVTNKGEAFFEFKNGKRTEQIPAEDLITILNDFVQECTSQMNTIRE